jgi:hypothetical protein|tara:strand:+ start:162 stop:371 length:210 start_codon:yes stop_codon:yes gene_type:complete
MSKQWHGGKGSKRRNSDEQSYADNWEKIFGKKEPEIKVRKVTPKGASSKVHSDKTKIIPRKTKYYDKID